MLRARIVYRGFSSSGSVERDPERAPARQREVVAVARVLLGEEVREQAGPRQQAVEVGGLPGVADDRTEVLVLEVEQEHVLETGNVRRGRGERRGPAGPRGHAEPQAVGDRPVVAHARRARAVDVGQRGGQDERHPGTGRPGGEHTRGGRTGESGRGRPDRAAAEHPAGRRQERHRHRGLALVGSAEPGGEAVAGAAGQQRAVRLPQPDQLPQPRGAAGAPGEQLPAAHCWPPPGDGREPVGAVADHGGQAAGHLPAGDRHAVPALGGHRTGLRTGIDQQVGAGPGDRARGLAGGHLAGRRERAGRQRCGAADQRGEQGGHATGAESAEVAAAESGHRCLRSGAVQADAGSSTVVHRLFDCSINPIVDVHLWSRPATLWLASRL